MAKYSTGGNGGMDFTPASVGTHMAVCTMVADVGLQPGSGQYPDPKIKVWTRFEIPGERILGDDGSDIGPAIVHHSWNASMNEKATMRKQIQSWRGQLLSDQDAEEYDTRKLLGQTCLLQVVHSKDGKYANVANIMAPPKGTPKLKPEGKTVYHGPEDDAQFADLPKFLQKQVENQLDAKPITHTGPPQRTPAPAPRTPDAEADRIAAQQADDFDDEIPF